MIHGQPEINIKVMEVECLRIMGTAKGDRIRDRKIIERKGMKKICTLDRLKGCI